MIWKCHSNQRYHAMNTPTDILSICGSVHFPTNTVGREHKEPPGNSCGSCRRILNQELRHQKFLNSPHPGKEEAVKQIVSWLRTEQLIPWDGAVPPVEHVIATAIERGDPFKKKAGA